MYTTPEAVYSYLPGHPLATEGLSKKKCEAVASALADFLRVLHAPPDDGGVCLPREDHRLVAHARYGSFILCTNASNCVSPCRGVNAGSVLSIGIIVLCAA